MGLIQREIERHGIPTVSISIQRELTEKTNPPRAVYLRWPYGHPLGAPFCMKQQRWILLDAFRALEEISVPGTIRDLGYKWRRLDRGRAMLLLLVGNEVQIYLIHGYAASDSEQRREATLRFWTVD